MFFTFLSVTIGFPVCFSISNLAFLAALPPLRAISLFYSNPLGCFSFDISVVDALANIFKTNSRLDLLSSVHP